MDNFPKCFHCSSTPAPIWPITSLEEWRLDVCLAEAFTEYCERNVTECKKERAINDLADEKRAVALEEKRQKLLRDQRVARLRNIHERKLNFLTIDQGGLTNMAKKAKTEGTEAAPKALKKTGFIDSLLRENLEGSYAEGAVDGLVTQVITQFPNEEAKKIRGLVFSRRAVLRKVAATPVTA